MIEISLDETRKIQLEILDRVVAFCDAHHINYFLCGGTLLGAIRHQGYIPWDDDIDLMMPRPDYVKFIEHFKIDGLKLYTFQAIKNYFNPFVKISDTNTVLVENGSYHYEIGINIDIFPIDGLPGDKQEAIKHVKKVSIYKNALIFKRINQREGRKAYKEALAKLIRFLLTPIPNHFLVSKITELAQKHPFHSSGHAGIVVWGYGVKEICSRDVFEKNTRVLFEQKLYNAPLKYQEYLSTVYGNYMELPPIEKRGTHHEFKFFRKES